MYFGAKYPLVLAVTWTYAARVVTLRTANINASQQKYVLNLPDWELPRTDELEWTLVETLADAMEKARLRPQALRDIIHVIVHGHLTELAESAVNETIEYWLKGLGDGNDGDWPELCVELPYLEHRETAEPLTLAYCVDNGDGSRTELNRTNLDAVVARVIDSPAPRANVLSRAKVMALALRQIADRLEKLSGEGTG